MITEAPKMIRSRWLRIRRTPRNLHRERPPMQIGQGLFRFRFRDGTTYTRRLWPGTRASNANTRLWPNRKARKAKPPRYDGMVRVRPSL